MAERRDEDQVPINVIKKTLETSTNKSKVAAAATSERERFRRVFFSWAQREKWNPGLFDLDAFFDADPGGFFMIERRDERTTQLPQEALTVTSESTQCSVSKKRDDSEVVAIVSAVRSTNACAFIGFYIVHPDWRRRGLGLQIFTHALKTLENGQKYPSSSMDRPRTDQYQIINSDEYSSSGPSDLASPVTLTGLDGVLAQVQAYESSGFRVSWENVRYSSPPLFPRNDHENERWRVEPLDGASPFCLVPLESVPLTTLTAFDEEFSGFRRPAFVSSWVRLHKDHAEDGCFAYAMYSANEGKGDDFCQYAASVTRDKDVHLHDPNVKRLVAVGAVRPSIDGYRIGPLYAREDSAARIMFNQLCTDVASYVSSRETPAGSYPDGPDHALPAGHRAEARRTKIICVDICSANAKAVALLEHAQWTPGFRTKRMWRVRDSSNSDEDPAKRIDLDGLYAVTSLELG